MNLHAIGIDLGKTVFHLVGLSQTGEMVVRKKFSRTQLLRFTANAATCIRSHASIARRRYRRGKSSARIPIASEAATAMSAPSRAPPSGVLLLPAPSGVSPAPWLISISMRAGRK